MPVTTPLIKIENTLRLGGEVMLAGEIFDEASRRRCASSASAGWSSSIRSTTRQVMAGQGTIGLEILEQVPEAR